ncbi:bile acid:sodium symporter [Methanofollis tationis]|uniref:Bile acid:sodium symporter n=1 Tax=Methanofollis tationis TaxID=81417 RepID=A0A7K4HP98_9EURY|nr:bile acid:sodium symporter [Methanofollis tationis]
MREHYAIIIISTLLIAIAVGLVSSAPGRFLQQYSVLFIVIMIGAMGFSITFKSLSASLKEWCARCLSLGLVLNFLFAPFLCWLLALLFLQEYPDFAVGLVLIGAVPCAGMAMVWTGLLKGDLPLATVINAVTMVLAPFLIPVIMLLFAGRFVVIDTTAMFVQVFLTVLLPLLIGISLREILEWRSCALKGHDKSRGPQHDRERAINVQHILPVMSAVSATMAVLLMFMAINTSVPLMVRNVAAIVPLAASTILIFPILFVSAYLLSVRLFPHSQNIALTYSAGMKNLPIAIGIASVSFGGLAMLPVAVGFAFQMLTAVVFYQIYRRSAPNVG